MKRKVFYSFHYGNDVMRTQQIRHIGTLEGNEPVSKNEWETVKGRGDSAIKNWIDENMKYKDCVVVLIGSETAKRPWVEYEIQKAWNDRRGLFGIYIHNLRDPRTGTCQKGDNPFENIRLADGSRLSSRIRCYDPNSWDAYNDIARNLENWVETAILEKRR